MRRANELMWVCLAVGFWLVLSGRVGAENPDVGDGIGEALSAYAMDVLHGWADGQGYGL